MKFHIIDWMSNVLFGGKTFDSFDEAWGFIYEQFPDEEEFDDYYVVQAGNTRSANYIDPKDPRSAVKEPNRDT